MVMTVEVAGYIPTNAYFYIDDASRRGFLIDPGAEADRLLDIIRSKDFIIEKILLTHGHFDHLGAVNPIKAELNVPVVIRKAGKRYVSDPGWNLSATTLDPLVIDDVTFAEDFAEISLAADKNFALKILPLAGHTEDGAVYYAERDKLAFVGDSIFKSSCGRTDLPGGNEAELFANIKKLLSALPDETVLYSGHSEPTTVAAEKIFWS